MNKLSKFMSVFMLALTVGSTVVPTAVSASEVTQEILNNEDNSVETSDTTSSEDNSQTDVNSESSNNSTEDNTEKESNAPNDGEIGFETLSTPIEDVTVTDIGYDETIIDSDLTKPKSLIKTFNSASDTSIDYTYNLDSAATLDDGLLALGLLSAARNYDNENNVTDGYNEAINVLDGNPVNNKDVFYSLINTEFKDYNKDTYITINNDSIFNIQDNNIRVILTGSGLHGVLETSNGKSAAMRYAGSGITEVDDSSLFTFSMSGVNPDYTSDTWAEGMTSVTGISAGYLTDGSQYLECMEFLQGVPNSVTNVSGQGQLGDYWQDASDNTKKSVIALGYALEKQDTTGSKLSEKEKSQGQYAIWTALVNNIGSLTTLQSTLESNKESGSFGSTFDSMFTEAQGFKDDGIDLSTVEYAVWGGVPTSNPGSNQSVMNINLMDAPIPADPYLGNVTINKYWDNSASSSIGTEGGEVTIEIYDGATKIDSATLGTDDTVTFSSLQVYDTLTDNTSGKITYTWKEVNNTDAYKTTNASGTFTLTPDTTTTLTKSNSPQNELITGSAKINKYWVDPNDSGTSYSGSNVDVRVWSSLGYDETKTLGSDDTATWSDMPVYRADGDKVTYNWRETNNTTNWDTTNGSGTFTLSGTGTTTLIKSNSPQNTVKKGGIEVYKITDTNDASNYNVVDTDLSGAEFSIYLDEDKDGVLDNSEKTAVDTITTGSDGHATTGKTLYPGKYLVQETKAPNYYDLNDTVFSVTVKADTINTAKVTTPVQNEMSKGNLIVEKDVVNDTAFDNNADPSTVTITIESQEDGRFYYTDSKTLNSNWKATFNDLPIGTYKVTETVATPTNMIIVNQTANVEVTKDTTTTMDSGEIKNELAWFQIAIEKRDTWFEELLGSGYTFAVYDYVDGYQAEDYEASSEPVTTMTTNALGKATSEKMLLNPDGTRKLFVVETDVKTNPDGSQDYFLNDGGITVNASLTNNEETLTFDYYNLHKTYTAAAVDKGVLLENGEEIEDFPLDGFEFTIYDWTEGSDTYGEVAMSVALNGTASQPQILITDTNGHADSGVLTANQQATSVDNMPIELQATYKISETGVPEGYEDLFIMPDDIIFSTDDPANLNYFSVINYLKTGDLKIIKEDEYGRVVPGVTYALYHDLETDSEGNYVTTEERKIGEATTNANGEASFTDLRMDYKYYIQEVEAPADVILTTDIIPVDFGGETEVTVNIENEILDVNLELTKKQTDTDVVLAGAEYKLTYTYDGEDKGQVQTTSTNGKLTFDNLPVFDTNGDLVVYTLSETKAPNGYNLNPEELVFTLGIDSDGNVLINDADALAEDAVDYDTTDSDMTTIPFIGYIDMFDDKLVSNLLVDKVNAEKFAIAEGNTVTPNTDDGIDIDTSLPGIDSETGSETDSEVDIETYEEEVSSETESEETIESEIDSEVESEITSEVSDDEFVESNRPKDYNNLTDANFVVTANADSLGVSATESKVIDEETSEVSSETVIGESINKTPREATSDIDSEIESETDSETDSEIDSEVDVVTPEEDKQTNEEKRANDFYNIMEELASAYSFSIANDTTVSEEMMNNAETLLTGNEEAIATIMQETNNDGYASFVLPVFDNDGRTIQYSLLETKAPDGYERDSLPHYFHFEYSEVSQSFELVYDKKVISADNLPAFNNEGYTLVTEDTDTFDLSSVMESFTYNEIGLAKVIDLTEGYNKLGLISDDYNNNVYMPFNNDEAIFNITLDKDVLPSRDDYTQDELDTIGINYEIATQEELDELANIRDEDLVNEETGTIYVENIDDIKDEFFDSARADDMINITNANVGTYKLIAKKDTVLTLNSETIELAKDEEKTIDFVVGDLLYVQSGNVDIYKTTDTTKLKDTTDNEMPIILNPELEMTGGNVEYRLWNNEDGMYAYDKTLLTAKDGRVTFPELYYMNGDNDTITYYLQEVGAPTDMQVDTTVYEMSYDVVNEKVTYVSIDNPLYGSNGKLSSIFTQVNGEELPEGITEDNMYVDYDNENTLYDNRTINLNRTNTVDVPYIEGPHEGDTSAYKTSFDENGDDYVSAGEKVTYEIGFANNWDVPLQNVVFQDRVEEQLSDYFEIDMKQALVVKVNDKEVETGYTLEDLNNGIITDVPAKSTIVIQFTLTAKDDLGTIESDVCTEEFECPDITNKATITVTEPETCIPDENGKLPEECIEPEICEPTIDENTGEVTYPEGCIEEEDVCTPTIDSETGEITYPEDCNTEVIEVTDTIDIDCEIPTCEILKTGQDLHIGTLLVITLGLAAGIYFVYQKAMYEYVDED